MSIDSFVRRLHTQRAPAVETAGAPIRFGAETAAPSARKTRRAKAPAPPSPRDAAMIARHTQRMDQLEAQLDTLDTQRVRLMAQLDDTQAKVDALQGVKSRKRRR